MRIRRINDPSTPHAVATGQFILIRRQVYELVQGHAGVRAEILEDVRLASRVKRTGHRVYSMHGDDLIRVRMYTNLTEIWEGLSKNALDMVGTIPGAVVSAIAGLLVAWMPAVVPLWVGVNLGTKPSPDLNNLALGLALLGSVVMLSGSVLATTPFRIPRWYGLLFPLALTMEAAITLNSVWRRLTRQTIWKGRVYP